MTVQPFRINVSQDILDDLQLRLTNTRWPDAVDDAAWEYGTNLDYLKEVVEYWRNDYDWRLHEAALNQFDHFRADIDGIGIHFIHQRGHGPNPTPVLLTHGWPDSFYRMVKIIPMLTNPAAFGGDPDSSFDVIVPSIPGFGFSDRVQKRGMTTRKIADCFARLMRDVLGYDRFAAAGGDMGTEVTMHLAHQYPDSLIGIHLTDVSYPMSPPDGVEMSDMSNAYMADLHQWWMAEGAFNMLQSTKPQTLGYGLTDSPVGLAGWIIEKFRTWSDCGGNVETRFSKDDLLTNIMIYWVTATISSSTRLYFEGVRSDDTLYPAPRIDVPVGIAKFVTEILPPREWVEHAMNVQHWTEFEQGGHFAALEEPKLYAADIRDFLQNLNA